MELKLEKIYHPCVLLTKKHYVGNMYESPDQMKPTIDAKGIETIRRDSCPAVSKILQKVLSLIFKTKDLSQVHFNDRTPLSSEKRLGTGIPPEAVEQDLGWSSEHQGFYFRQRSASGWLPFTHSPTCGRRRSSGHTFHPIHRKVLFSMSMAGNETRPASRTAVC